MSDSNEPADGADLQPQTPAPSDQPQSPQEPPPSPADEQDAAPPSPDPRDTPAPPAEEDTSPPPADEQEAPTPADEQDVASPAVDPQDTPASIAAEDAPPPLADEQDAATPAAEQDAAPPSPDPRDTPAPPAEEDTSPPPADEQEAPTPADEQDAASPAVEPQDTPASTEEDTPTAPTDSPSDEASEVEAADTKKSDQPAGETQAPRTPGKGRSGRSDSPRRRPGKPPKGPSVIIRYGLMGHIGQFRHNLQPAPARDVKVVVRTDRGVELGQVVTVVSDEPGLGYISPERLEEHIASGGPDYPFRRDGKVLRLANPQDLIDQRHLNSSAKDERKFCAQEIKEVKLDMKLVAAEHLLGGERIIFYFLAEHRVDFRELVHKLADQYHTRIEMRQVGARDEARLVADYERCGQVCCCKEFLKGLQPISMRMAKTQKATLDPSKISGRCGRLMCCLRYEDQCYRDLKKCLPHRNIWVKTCDQIGRVTGMQILTQLVQVQLPDGSRGVFANEDIIERNVDPPREAQADAQKTPAPKPTPRRGDRDRSRKDSAQSGQQARPDADKQTTKPPRQKEPQPAPLPTAKREFQPRASAEALDPAWAGLLGDSISEDDLQPTSQPSQDPPTGATAPPVEEPDASPEPREGDSPTPEPMQHQAAAPADQSSGEPAQQDEKRKKRRRRRGRRSKRKPGN